MGTGIAERTGKIRELGPAATLRGNMQNKYSLERLNIWNRELVNDPIKFV